MPNLRWDERAERRRQGLHRRGAALVPAHGGVHRAAAVRADRALQPARPAVERPRDVHRDAEDEAEVGHFITLCPRGDKRLFLWDEERQARVPVGGRAYWFDDRNYHGVAADPFFRYSIRVDGVFDAAIPGAAGAGPRVAPGWWSSTARGVLDAGGVRALGRAASTRARADWTPCFEGVQFTLGRAYYTHLEEDRDDEYFARRPRSDALVERALPGLQARVRAHPRRAGGRARRRRGPAGAVPACTSFRRATGSPRTAATSTSTPRACSRTSSAARAPALSAIVMLQPPARGGGLRVWDALYDGRRRGALARRARARAPSSSTRPATWCVIDSYRLHQIQPFAGARDRISVTAHLVFADGRWQAWF